MARSVMTMDIGNRPRQRGEVKGKVEHVQKRPFGVTMMALLMLTGGMFCICAAFSETPAGIAGMAVSGMPAVVIHFLHGGISFYIFSGFMKLRRSAWNIYMIFLAFGVTNNLVTIIISSGSPNQLVPVMLMCLFGYYIYRKKELFVN